MVRCKLDVNATILSIRQTVRPPYNFDIKRSLMCLIFSLDDDSSAPPLDDAEGSAVRGSPKVDACKVFMTPLHNITDKKVSIHIAPDVKRQRRTAA